MGEETGREIGVALKPAGEAGFGGGKNDLR